MKNDFIEMLYDEAEYYDIVKYTILIKMKAHGGISDFDLQDCISEVFVEAMKKRHELEAHPSPKAWLNLTAKNIAKRYIKRRIIEGMLFYGNGSVIPELINADDEYHKLCFEFFDTLKTTLNPTDYKLYDMKFNQKLSNAEIADVLKKNKHSVDMKLTRLKKKIKNIFYEV